MPYRDGTGPMGVGPMTGRGLGNCRNGAGLGRGHSMGMGRGMGGGRRFGACGFDPFVANVASTPSVELQKQALSTQQKFLEARLDALKAQIDALQNPSRNTPTP